MPHAAQACFNLRADAGRIGQRGLASWFTVR
jgi:hypothetical protein